MNKSPRIWSLEYLIKHINENYAEINNRWVPARPVNYTTFAKRLKYAWLVFKGKADAVIWPENQ